MMSVFILAPDFDPELVESYKIFNRDGKDGINGIDAGELMEVLAKFDYPITLEEANNVIDEADWDGDKMLAFPEFCNIMMGRVWFL